MTQPPTQKPVPLYARANVLWTVIGVLFVLIIIFGIAQSQTITNGMVVGFLVVAFLVLATLIYLIKLRRPASVWKVKQELQEALLKKRVPGLRIDPSGVQVDVLSETDYLCYVPEEGGCYRRINGQFVGGVVPGLLHEVKSRMQRFDIERKFAEKNLRRFAEEFVAEDEQ